MMSQYGIDPSFDGILGFCRQYYGASY